MPFVYPLMLDVTDPLAVIIGGGRVAARKAKGLIEAGATRIRVVAPDFAPEVPKQAERITERYHSRYLDGARLVFAATDSVEVNQQVVRDAQARGIWVNCAEEGASAGDFIVPARFQEGEVIVSVSAGGPALAVAIRNDLARRLDRRQIRMAKAMRTLRSEIRAHCDDRDVRAAIFRELASEDALAVLEARGIDALRLWIVEKHPNLKL